MNNVFNLYRHVRFKHLARYLYQRLSKSIDPYVTHVLSKEGKWVSIWSLNQLKNRQERVIDDLYIWELGGRKWLANLDQVHGLYEYLSGAFEIAYQTDFTNKRVLDIGGYVGDSALFALQKGAKEIIIYEPVKKNIQAMLFNLKEVQNQVKIIPKALGHQNQVLEIFSETPGGHVGFGFSGKGSYHLKVDAETISTILDAHPVDIVKIDCEGGEKALLSAEQATLRKVPLWMIETHQEDILVQMNKKFEESGFQVIRGPWPNKTCGISHYRLVD